MADSAAVPPATDGDEESAAPEQVEDGHEVSVAQAPHPLDDALEDRGEDEEDDEDEDEDDEDDASSYTSASALEEEALYEDQPACGLSPRLVVRRGVQQLLEADRAGSTSQLVAPALQRVDTVLGFENAVGNTLPEGLVSPLAAGSSSALPPALGRITTLSGLPELVDAEAALEGFGNEGGSYGGTVTDGSNGSATTVGASSSSAAASAEQGRARSKAEPQQVRRIDTMEFLTADDLVDEPDMTAAEGTSRPSKRVKVGGEA